MDTRNLRKRGGTWYLDSTFPGVTGTDLSGRRVRLSLESSDYRTARGFRDRYL